MAASFSIRRSNVTARVLRAVVKTHCIAYRNLRIQGGTRERSRPFRAAILLGRRAGETGLVEKAVPALIAAMEQDEAPKCGSYPALGKYGANAARPLPGQNTFRVQRSFETLTLVLTSCY
ncbi:MAG: hypothetical protein ACI9R3_005478 [Verrucomicrobiales bacterium]|jgi:hypothetical protein